jgi:hypothetical protein
VRLREVSHAGGLLAVEVVVLRPRTGAKVSGGVLSLAGLSVCSIGIKLLRARHRYGSGLVERARLHRYDHGQTGRPAREEQADDVS